jgi:hypothetical protein
VRGAIHRFLDENLLTIANVTPSEVAAGQITQATKTVSSGGAAGTPGGTYTGLVELQWVVKISSVGGGTGAIPVLHRRWCNLFGSSDYCGLCVS